MWLTPFGQSKSIRGCKTDFHSEVLGGDFAGKRGMRGVATLGLVWVVSGRFSSACCGFLPIGICCRECLPLWRWWMLVEDIGCSPRCFLQVFSYIDFRNHLLADDVGDRAIAANLSLRRFRLALAWSARLCSAVTIDPSGGHSLFTQAGVLDPGCLIERNSNHCREANLNIVAYRSGKTNAELKSSQTNSQREPRAEGGPSAGTAIQDFARLKACEKTLRALSVSAWKAYTDIVTPDTPGTPGTGVVMFLVPRPGKSCHRRPTHMSALNMLFFF